MTENGTPVSPDIPAFYDRLAPDYDEMTGFGRRFVHEKPFFRLLVENHHIAEAIFKAFALALRKAATIHGRIEGILSTKGSL